MSTFGEREYGWVGGQQVVEYSLANQRWIWPILWIVDVFWNNWYNNAMETIHRQSPNYLSGLVILNTKYCWAKYFSSASSWKCSAMARPSAAWKFRTLVELGGRSFLALTPWKDISQMKTGWAWSWRENIDLKHCNILVTCFMNIWQVSRRSNWKDLWSNCWREVLPWRKGLPGETWKEPSLNILKAFPLPTSKKSTLQLDLNDVVGPGCCLHGGKR